MLPISLRGITPDHVDDFNSAYRYTNIYRIPKDRTQGRSITSALHVTFSDFTKSLSYGAVATNHQTTMMSAGNAVMDAMGSIPITSTSRVQLIGENVVMVRDVVMLPPNIFLLCVIENDENMSHLQLKSYRQFAELVVHAVKAYIWNEYIIQMDIGELHGGQSIGRFKEIIDEYKEEDELYRTFLVEKWDRIAFMNDEASFNRLLKSVISGNR